MVDKSGSIIAETIINMPLARSRNLTDKDIEELEATYLLLRNVLEYPELTGDPTAKVTELEYELQRLWKFPQDAKFHKYQLFMKGCTCPVLDNAELYGHTKARYIAGDCPWHYKGDK